MYAIVTLLSCNKIGNNETSTLRYMYRSVDVILLLLFLLFVLFFLLLPRTALFLGL